MGIIERGRVRLAKWLFHNIDLSLNQITNKKVLLENPTTGEKRDLAQWLAGVERLLIQLNQTASPYPICFACQQPILPGQQAYGGSNVGVTHIVCPKPQEVHNAIPVSVPWDNHIAHIKFQADRTRDAERLANALQERLDALMGPRCTDEHCEDHDGEHPYHQSQVIKAFESGKDEGRRQMTRERDKAIELQRDASSKLATISREYNGLTAATAKINEELVRVTKACDAFESNSKEASEVYEVLMAARLIPAEKPGPRLADIVKAIMAAHDNYKTQAGEFADKVVSLTSDLTKALKRGTELLDERDQARAMLLRLYYANYIREEWQEGENEEEAKQAAGDSLANWDIDPHQPKHKERVEAILKAVKS